MHTFIWQSSLVKRCIWKPARRLQASILFLCNFQQICQCLLWQENRAHDDVGRTMWPFFTRFSRGERSKGANLNAIVRRPFKFTATLAAVTRLLLRCLSERTRKQNGANKGPPHGISKQKMNCAHRQIHFYLSLHAAAEDEKPMHFTASAPVLRRESAQRDPAASKTHKSQSRRKSQRHFSSACFFSLSPLERK